MMMRFFSTFGLPLLLLLPTHITEAAPLVENHEDRVKSLPGYDAPLPSPWYSGFLEYELEGQAIKTHYILVEAENIRPKRTTPTPLIYWSNGGPGASSLFGLMTELGPLLLSDDSVNESGLPTAIYNHNSWTRIGHILIFDAPAPVGFSQCGDEQTKACVSWTDELASQNAYLALQTFFTKKFPVLQQTPLYLTGESYAGIYIPTLARRIVEDNDFVVNLKGFAVGDGCLGTETGICGSLSGSRINFWHVIFLAGHGQVPLTTLQIVMDACKADMKIGFTARETDACDDALKLLKTQVGGYYEYALYDECTYRNGLLGNTGVAGALNDYPCGGGDVLEAYVKLDVVKKALNVPSSSTFFSVDNAENFDYTPTEKDLTGFYISQTDKLRMLVYNGDTDPAITSFAAQNWTSSLGLEVTQDWRPWTLDECQRVGGYVTRYAGGLDYLTIRGAGHLVPTYKPEAAFSFMKSWIEGEDYLQYKPDCKKPPQQQEQLDTVVVAAEGETQGVAASVSSSLRG